MIPLVVASERGTAQTSGVARRGWGCRTATLYANREQNTLENVISHLSSFSIVEADEAAVGTQFLALFIDNIRGNENYIASFKDAQQVVCNGPKKVLDRLLICR